MKNALFVSLVISLAPLALAQKWEFGGGAGGGFYTSKDVQSGSLSGSAKVGNGLLASAWLANNNNDRWGGEIRYDFQMGDLLLNSGGTKASFAGQAHALHYDLLLHTAPREARVRPFIAFGGGVKMYRGTGEEVASQPLNQLALLTKTLDTRPLLSVGAGVKINSRRVGLRIEAHDFITPFPGKVIAAADGSTLGGLMHDFVVNVGLSFLVF